MEDKVKDRFFKLLKENPQILAELLSDDSDSETASVKSAVTNTRHNPKYDGAGASKPDDMNKEVLKELECPICFELMTPPITMCYNGHNICSNCRPKLKKCPTCKKSFLKVRNRALESFVQKMESPCCFAKYGCGLSFPPGVVDHHQNICAHRPYRCPLFHAERINCCWTDVYLELKEHIEAVHQDRLTLCNDEKKVVMKKFIPKRKYSRIIFACGEIFYQQFQVIDDIFYFIIQHVGPESSGLKYRYTFSLAIPNNIEAIFIAFIARSYKVDINDVFRSGQCVKLHYDTVKNFMEENDTLVFQFCITQANRRH